MKTIQKKEVENLQGFILSIVGIAVALAVGLIVLGQLRTSVASGTANVDGINSTAWNSTGSILIQMSTIPNWVGILITVALAFIVLGYFYSR
jgi:ABC-type antimicrobial peptide transport system permease subunit